jgi:hypothetical protein
MQEGNKKENSHWKFTLPILAFIFVCFMMTGTFLYMMLHFSGDSAWAIRGQFGDMFGFTNAFFSGLAFAGIIITIVQQQREIRRQDAAIQKQNHSIVLQRFETTLFEVINLHRTRIANLFINDQNKGAQVFDYITTYTGRIPTTDYDVLAFRLVPQNFTTLIDDNTLLTAVIRQYLESFKSVVAIIEESPLLNDRTDKEYYCKLLMAFLDNSELRFIFYYRTLYNSKTKEEWIAFKEFSDRINVLDRIKPFVLLNNSHYVPLKSYNY